MSNTIPNTNISIKDDLHIKWTDANGHELIGVSETSGPYKMSDLRGALFIDGSTIASTGPIKMSDIKGKHFAQKFNTDGYKVFSTNSAHSTHLYGTTDSFGASNRRAKLESGQSSSYPYSIMLVTPHGRGSNDSPGLVVDRTAADVVDEATLWFKAVNHNVPLAVQMGIIKKDNDLTWSQQLSYLHNKHGQYADRLNFSGGYHAYSGSRDDLKSTTTIVTPAYTQNSGNDGTYGSNLTSNFHNIIGKTAGTMRSAYSGISSDSGGAEYWFFKYSYTNYDTYKNNNNTSILSNHGVKIKWYTTTLPVTFTQGSSEITPQSPNSTWSPEALSNVFSGMYLSGTNKVSLDSDGKGVFIGKVYTDSITMYQETGVSSLTEITASTSGNDTITISGYLYWTLATTDTYSNPVILGPPHTVLPRYHADSPGGAPTSITEWAFFIGDTTSATTNTFEYDIRDTEPGGTTFSYSVSYGLKPDPPPATYEYAFNNYSTLADPLSGILSGVTPSLSGINIRDPPGWTNISWYGYSMGHRYKFLVSGQIVAIGSMNRYSSELKLFLDGNSTAVASASAWSAWSYDATNRYRYVTLSSPVSVSANQSYWVMIKNYSGGYSGHPYTVTPYPSPPKTTTSGNIQFTAAGYRYTGRGTNSSSSQSSLTQYPSTILSSTNYLYGNTDLIFLPD